MRFLRSACDCLLPVIQITSDILVEVPNARSLPYKMKNYVQGWIRFIPVDHEGFTAAVDAIAAGKGSTIAREFYRGCGM